MASSRRAWLSSRFRACISSSRPSLAFCTADFITPDRLVVDLERNREGMAVLAAMGQREARGIAEAVGRAVHDLGDHRERADRARADAGREQQIGEVDRAALGRRRERRRAGDA